MTLKTLRASRNWPLSIPLRREATNPSRPAHNEKLFINNIFRIAKQTLEFLWRIETVPNSMAFSSTISRARYLFSASATHQQCTFFTPDCFGIVAIFTFVCNQLLARWVTQRITCHWQLLIPRFRSSRREVATDTQMMLQYRAWRRHDTATLNNWRGLMFVIKKKHCLSPGESKNEPQNVISLKTNTKVNKFASVFAIATSSIVWRAWQVALCEMLTNVRWPLLETSGFIENMIT